MMLDWIYTQNKILTITLMSGVFLCSLLYIFILLSARKRQYLENKPSDFVITKTLFSPCGRILATCRIGIIYSESGSLKPKREWYYPFEELSYGWVSPRGECIDYCSINTYVSNKLVEGYSREDLIKYDIPYDYALLKYKNGKREERNA